MHMISYLGGDAGTFAVRTAQKESVLLNIDLPDIHAAVTLQITHEGAVHLSGTTRQGAGFVEHGGIVAHLDPITGVLTLVANPELERVL